MAKLYFRYGAMGASKTANALMVQYNYMERGKRALLCKPALDNRDGDQLVHSRMGRDRGDPHHLLVRQVGSKSPSPATPCGRATLFRVRERARIALLRMTRRGEGPYKEVPSNLDLRMVRLRSISFTAVTRVPCLANVTL